MKILHIHDIAGVASILAKYQRKAGHHVKVMMRQSNDTLNITSFYETTLDVSSGAFMKLAIKEAKHFDIIHIHNISKLCPVLRLLYPRKKIIIHFHGKYSIMIKKYGRFYARFANAIIVSTPDLLQYFKKAWHLPTIIDTDHFNGKPTGNKQLSFTIRYLDTDRFISKYPNVIIIDREKTPVPYSQMPDCLKTFDTYVDVKYFRYTNAILRAHSKTCYEALACGLDVINWAGNTLRGLPEIHKPENITSQLIKFYSQL